MTAEIWPDATAAYRYPAATPDNSARWSAAITSSLEGGAMALLPTSASSDVYELSGPCPRCGHEMSQSIEFDVIVGTLPVRTKFGVFNIQCDCTETHHGRDDKHKGCGWGGPIPVRIIVR